MTAVVVAVDVASTVWAWTSLPNGGKVATFGVTLSLLNNRGAAFASAAPTQCWFCWPGSRRRLR